MKTFCMLKKHIDRHCLPFASDLFQVVENIDDISDTSWRFFNLGSQVNTSHSNNLDKLKKAEGW